MSRLTLQGHSLRRVLLISILVPTFGSVLLTLAVVSWLDTRAFQRAMEDGARRAAHLIADYSAGDLAFGAREESADALAVFGRDAAYPAIALYDAEGQIFSSFLAEGVVLPPRITPAAPALRAARADAVFEVWQPVSREGARYGTLYLRASTSELDGRVAAHRLTLGLLGLALAALGFAVALIARRAVAEPILTLASTADHIAASRDYGERLTPSGAREVRQLGVRLNGMLAAIEEHQRERDAALAEVAAHSAGLEQRVRQRTAALETSNRELEAFSYSVSHDLRAPVRAIRSFTSLILEDYGDSMGEEGREYAERVVGAAARLDCLIQDLLEYARVGQESAPLAPVDVEGVPQAYQERIFRLFERLEGLVGASGTGVGLAIVKRATERMGGQTGVICREGEGASFWIDLAEARAGDQDDASAS